MKIENSPPKNPLPLWVNGPLLLGITQMGKWILESIGNITIDKALYTTCMLSGIGISMFGLFKTDKIEQSIQIIMQREDIYIKRKEPKPYGYEMLLTLPCGMSLNHFNERKDEIEQYLDAEVEFQYKHKHIKTIVRTGELKDSYPFKVIDTPSPVNLVLGYSREGLEIIDLVKAVHVLIAGETGSGKSVALRSIITNLILTKPHLMLNLVDFKRVELGIFKQSKNVKNFCKSIEDFDHLLDELTAESERRYDLLESKNLVNIQSYNKKYSNKLPNIITIIDEFASLEDEKEIMKKLKRRLEKDRACGIHYIICTQRPSHKILSGDIKANIPTIVSFRTSNKLNSQIILDEAGAEQLPGSGAGLLKHDKVKRIQTMYLSETEAQRLIKHTFVKKEEIKQLKDTSGVIDIGNQKRPGVIPTNRKI